MKYTSNTKILYLKIHPAAKKYLINKYEYNKDILFINDMYLNNIIINSINRKNLTIPSRVSKKLHNLFVPLKIAISNHTFYNIGYDMTEYNQSRFSRLVYNKMLDELCTNIFAGKIIGINRIEIINTFYAEYDLTEDDLKVSFIYKYYKRNWGEIENKWQKEHNPHKNAINITKLHSQMSKKF